MDWTTVLLGIGLLIIAYLVIGYLFHLIVFPETTPDLETYFEPGDQFGSDVEGDEITVLARENGAYRLKLHLDPGAEGPPVHIHTGWDETYKVNSGPFGILIEEKKKILKSGEEFTIRRGVPHKIYNPTDKPVDTEVVMPAQFTVYLSQVYGYMDEDEKNIEPPRIIFQMAIFNQYFDSYLAEGPPIFVQKVLNFMIIPLARLMGYRSFYEKYRIQ